MRLPRAVYHSNYWRGAFVVSRGCTGGLTTERVEASYGANTRGRILVNTLAPYKLHGECARNSEFHLALPLARNPRGHSRTTISLCEPILFLRDYVLLQSSF